MRSVRDSFPASDARFASCLGFAHPVYCTDSARAMGRVVGIAAGSRKVMIEVDTSNKSTGENRRYAHGRCNT